MNKSVDVAVIGAGQAGLAVAYYLKKRGISFLCIDRNEAVGDAWRHRYDSLVLFTPRWYSALPGRSLEGDPNGYPSKDEIADYLQAYVTDFDLPVQLGTPVQALETAGARYQIRTDQGIITANQVVVATGPFQRPAVPPLAGGLSASVVQLHSSVYRRPEQLQPGPALVVGGGNSGAQIAVELAASGREVAFSAAHALKFIPLDVLGRSVFGWMDALGILGAPRDSRIGNWLRKRKDPIFGRELARCLKRGNVRLMPRTVSAEGDIIRFEDGSEQRAANVVWATGFRPDFAWIRIPGAVDAQGLPVHKRGIGAHPGLYYVGLPWQHSRGSALVGGVGEDAEFVVERICI